MKMHRKSRIGGRPGGHRAHNSHLHEDLVHEGGAQGVEAGLEPSELVDRVVPRHDKHLVEGL